MDFNKSVEKKRERAEVRKKTDPTQEGSSCDGSAEYSAAPQTR